MNLEWHWPWAGAIGLVAAIVLIAAWQLVCMRRPSKSPQIPVFDLDDDLNTEHVDELFRQWRVLSRVAVVVLAMALLVSSATISRPSTVDEADERASNRDIVLCLDVSPSMLSYDHEVLASYQRLVSNFKGERIGLSLFNSTSRTLFPLTDDYQLVSGQLKNASDILASISSQDKIDKTDPRTLQKFSDLIEGTQNRKDKTSLIGDGLVSCAAMLPGFTFGSDNRSKDETGKASIVLATDNFSGKSNYTLGSALDLTHKAGIVVDGLYAGPASSENDRTTTEMQRDITSHGGSYFSVHSGKSIENLVQTIEKRKNRDERRIRKAALVDAPGWWTLALALLAAVWISLAWRLKR
ncbi:VWA domain-containing protein [Bifidobacterium sp. ESL0798]|uniref:vWA domain-containing protein n=1 Tax=unclassified Bifidobacterium TaxID=2608897 RepID=UPI0023FA17F0|nr:MULTISPECIES: VWA domain-containing protein [unclassified Bifidobacterium]WEV53633.1 VWA domain-containing protein [Bifidobacterium sp. ESL0704]WEV73400.1 VWA domain-containing protein [Bifidobacterium sp. ESL0798]